MREIYGTDFPGKFFELWGVLSGKFRGDFDRIEEFLDAAAGVKFSGLIKVFRDGNFVPDLNRYYDDIPEFVTVLEGLGNGEHWGYWLPELSRKDSVILLYSFDEWYSAAGTSLFTLLANLIENMLPELDEDDEDTAVVIKTARSLLKVFRKKIPMIRLYCLT